MAEVLIASDLEGVFSPELWPIIGQRLGIPELSATTRDVPNFKQLMESRIAALKRNDIKFSQIEGILHEVSLFRGAEEMMDKMSGFPGVECVMITDSFKEFAKIVLKKTSGWKVFANSFNITHGTIESCNLEIGGKKGEVLKKFKGPTQTIIALGDSFNDVDMLKMARYKILFNPISELRSMFSDAVVCRNYTDLTEILNKLLI